MRRHPWLANQCLIAMLLLSACGAGKGSVVIQPGATPEPVAQPTPQVVLPTSNLVLVDGQVTHVHPPLQLGFPGGVSGELLALQVQIGQRVKKGELIASLDDSDLRQAVQDAQIALNRAVEDKAQWQADTARKLRRETDDAEERYQQQSRDAEKKYQSELEDARRALERAKQDLQRLQMQPPTTSLAEAKASLAQALDAESQAGDNYKQALDRPWEHQSIRDSYYKEWQVRIKDRELAQLRLQDAQTALTLHSMDVQAREEDVRNAQADLEQIEKDEVKKEEIDKDVDPAYDRALEDAQRQLARAQQDLDHARLIAPWDGLVQSIDPAVGSLVGSGAPVITLLNITDLYFTTDNLSERHVAMLLAGQKATITLRTYPENPLTGRVEVVLPRLDRQTDAEARFTAYIRLDTSDLDLLPGMTGRVEIVTGD